MVADGKHATSIAPPARLARLFAGPSTLDHTPELRGSRLSAEGREIVLGTGRGRSRWFPSVGRYVLIPGCRSEERSF
jgi:hypothetical protein